MNEPVTNTLLTAIGTAFTQMITWIGDVVDAVATSTGELKELLPLLAIGIAISVVFVGVKAIKSFCWGA